MNPHRMAGAALALVVALWGCVEAWGTAGPTTPDAWWADLMRDLRVSPGIALARFFDLLGGPIVSGIVVPAAVAGALVLARRRWAALYLIVASAASAAAVKIVKLTVARPRPDDILVTADFGAFPSGHSANAAVVVTVIAILFTSRRWLPAVGGAYVATMMLSRTYLSAHWLTDTIAGAALGFTVAMTVWVFMAGRVTAETTVHQRDPLGGKPTSS